MLNTGSWTLAKIARRCLIRSNRKLATYYTTECYVICCIFYFGFIEMFTFCNCFIVLSTEMTKYRFYSRQRSFDVIKDASTNSIQKSARTVIIL